MSGLAVGGYHPPVVPLPFPSLLRAVVVVALVLALPRPAAADEAERCYHDKMRAGRMAVAALFFCEHGPGNDPLYRSRCADAATRRLNRRLVAADARALSGGFVCPGDADALALAGTWNWPARFVGDALGGASRSCVSAQVRAGRRYALAFARCVEAADANDDEAIAACSASPRSTFANAWQAPSGDGACTGSDASGPARRIEEELLETSARLQVRCGDGLVGGHEECDDGNAASGDGCSADCRVETCGRVGDDVRCIACPRDAMPNEAWDGCRCPAGFSGEAGSCTDIDECAVAQNPCGDGRPCVNLAGTFACAIPCTAEALRQALADCGAPSGAIAFDCNDTTIRIPNDAAAPSRRDVSCNGLTIDGAGRGISFELDPLCWRTPLDPSLCPDGLETDGTCACPNVDSGAAFLMLRGNGNVVRDLTVRGFFDGIPVRGRDNLVENVRFDRMCDDAFGSVETGVGNVFRRLSVREGCDKCSENGGPLEGLDPNPRVNDHFNAILTDVDFQQCRTPVRVASSGRLRLDRVSMLGGDAAFPCDGPRFSAATDDQRVIVSITNSSVERCRRGVRFGRGSEGFLAGDRIAGCGLRGLRAAESARVVVEGTTIEHNGGGGSAEAGFGGVAVLDQAAVDLGGGNLVIDGVTTASRGENSFCANSAPGRVARNLDNATTSMLAAQGNWWCPAADGDGVAGPVLRAPRLDRAPLRHRAAR